jgi:hypothetical protein
MTKAATALLLTLLVLPATAVAQAPPPPACAPDKTANVTLEGQESGQEAALIATHEVDVTANIAASNPTQIEVTPQAGVDVLKKGSNGATIVVFAPTTPELTVTVSWRQSADESNPEETARCSASRTLSLPVLAAHPAYGAKQPNPGPKSTGDVTFAVVPTVKRPDLRPLEVSVRSTAHARYPKPNERLRTWVIPMRTAEQLRYKGRLPNLAYATTAQKCRFWWLTCGPAFAEVAALNVDDKALNRGIVRPDLDGSNAILRSLAYTQPARWAPRYGIVVDVRPGARSPQLYGYDVQVRQAGRLLARIRRAGRCAEERRSVGIFHACTLARSSTLLR